MKFRRLINSLVNRHVKMDFANEPRVDSKCSEQHGAPLAKEAPTIKHDIV